jgi:2,3-bisphosphoglycerate-independent phosphoglycerate mutase
MGNSEVGHLNIGAGRVVYQDIVRIDLALQKGQFPTLPNVKAAFEHARDTTGRLHLLGLVSDGGVHAHIQHLFGLLRAAKELQVPQTFVHFFGDGRDTAPKSAVLYLQQLLAFMQELEYGQLATVTGRYYAMDRDKRWERIQIAVQGLTRGGEPVEDVVQAVQRKYEQSETDEFLKPLLVHADGLLRNDDTLFFFNYRADRMREINQVLSRMEPVTPVEWDNLNLSITTMTQYKADFGFPVAFPPQTMDNVLAEWLAKHNVKQCHVAETEKYAHVTFFFNGGREVQFSGEDRRLVDSPRVATYDLLPQMSAHQVGDTVAQVIGTGQYELVMCNFAPPDMVGHTGVYEAAIQGVEATDAAIGVIYEACKQHGYVLFVTADHGNAEKMLNKETGQPHTAHTTAPVPFIMANTDKALRKDVQGALCDVAPTLLCVMGLPVPDEMTGQSLLVE